MHTVLTPSHVSVSPFQRLPQSGVGIFSGMAKPDKVTFSSKKQVAFKSSQPLTKKKRRWARHQLEKIAEFLPVDEYDQKLLSKNETSSKEYGPISLYRRFLELPDETKRRVMTALTDPMLPLKLHDPTLEGKRELGDVLWELAYKGELSFYGATYLKEPYEKAIENKRGQCEPHPKQLQEEIQEMLDDGHARQDVRKNLEKKIKQCDRRRKVKMTEKLFHRVLELMGWGGQLDYSVILELALEKMSDRHSFHEKNIEEGVAKGDERLQYHRRKYSYGLFEKIWAAHRIGNPSRVHDKRIRRQHARWVLKHALKDKVYDTFIKPVRSFIGY